MITFSAPSRRSLNVSIATSKLVQRERVGVEFVDPDPSVGNQGHRSPHATGGCSHTHEFLLVQHEILERQKNVLDRDTHRRTPPTLVEHGESPPVRVGNTGAVEGNIRPDPVGQSFDRLDRIARDVVDGLESEFGRLRETLAAADDDHPACAEGSAQHQPASSPTGPGPSTTTVSPELMFPRSAVWSAMAAGIEQSTLLETQLVWKMEHRLDAVNDVLGERALPVVAVLPVHVGVAVVLTNVVAALDALLAEAARVVGCSRHTVADRKAEGVSTVAEFAHHPGPLVAGDERVRRRPEARVVTPQEMGIGSADRDGIHPTQNLLLVQASASEPLRWRTRSEQ